ncbi:glutamate racemase [Halomonas halocynthiae]|uniref:glutamate racemase n=1 Tax=Halomonas halocynthiae TaxID=176290 RepID=UPI000486AC06|nr:glutamate racemase [Halomonas halocynthiae]
MAGPILVFDSGVGGLSVVAALRQRLPSAELTYACDNAMLPYGVREDDWLVKRIVEVCGAAVNVSGCVGLVVACNTASTLALDRLRQHLDVPVIGTVPAIKPAAELSRSRHIGLLATSATVRRPYTDQLIHDFAGNCRVTRVAADALVVEAEQMVRGKTPDLSRIRDALAPLDALHDLDTVVLGCTHFPLLRDWLSGAMTRPLRWVDSGDAIARRCAQIMPITASRGSVETAWLTALTPELAVGLRAHGFKNSCSLVID